MNKEAKAGQLDQDELDKYPGLMHCIIFKKKDAIHGVKLNMRTFHKLSHILTGNSLSADVIIADTFEEFTNTAGVPYIEIFKGSYKFHLMMPQVEFTFKIPKDYAERRSQKKEKP